MTMIQTLSHTIDLDTQIIIISDALRKQCNINDYSGDIMPRKTVDKCILNAEDLLKRIEHWLKRNKPELLEQ